MKPRIIRQWSRSSDCMRARECYECRERITWGKMRREVVAIGRSLQARFLHESCV